MGSAGKLSQKKRRIKLQTIPSPGKTLFDKKKKKLGPYLPFRHPLNPFFYNKSRRKAPGLRASMGYRNHYSWYWRRYLLKTVDAPLKVFSLGGAVKMPGAFKKHDRGKKAIDIGLGKENKAEKAGAVKRHGIKERKPEKVPQEVKAEVRIPDKKKAAAAESIKAAVTEHAENPEPVRIKVSKNVELRNKSGTAPIEVKTEGIQTERQGPAKIVTKSVKAGKNRAIVYKTVATTKKPRTSTAKVHAENDGRRSVGKPPNTSNSDFARVVPSFSLFSIPVRLLKRFPASKIKPEGIISSIEVKTQGPKTDVKTGVKTEPKAKNPGADPYHTLNKGEKRLIFQKIASSAADAIN